MNKKQCRIVTEERWMTNKILNSWIYTSEMNNVIGNTTHPETMRDYFTPCECSEDYISNQIRNGCSTILLSFLIYLKEKIKIIYSDFQYPVVRDILKYQGYDTEEEWFQLYVYGLFDNTRIISVNTLEELASEFMKDMMSIFDIEIKNVYATEFQHDEFDLIQYVINKKHPCINFHNELASDIESELIRIKIRDT